MQAARGACQGGGGIMLVKYSFHIGERIVAISMEREFWDALRDIAANRDTTLSVLVRGVIAECGSDLNRRRLSSVLRVYILEQHMPETMRAVREAHHRGASSSKSQKKRVPRS